MRHIGSMLGPLAAVTIPLLLGAAPPAQAAEGLEKLSHILVIYLENRSFDNLFGEFPRANGIDRAGAAAVQRKRDDTEYSNLPPPKKKPFDVRENPDPSIRDIPFPGNLRNQPFAVTSLDPRITLEAHTLDPVHRFYTNRAQIHDGQLDRFVLFSDAAGMVMSYYPAKEMENTHLWRLTKDHTLLDNFFQGAFGGSFLNHIWMVCACAPVWPNPPNVLRSRLDAEGIPVYDEKKGYDDANDRILTAAADGDYAVNTILSTFLHPPNPTRPLLPAQTAVTIGDRLTEKGIDWAWYSGGWNLAVKATMDILLPEEKKDFDLLNFQWHHQPFAYFSRFDPNTDSGRAERNEHLKDARDLEHDIRDDRLPPVAFYKPAGVQNQHPGYSNVKAADEEVNRIVTLLGQSAMKDSYAVIITYDEFGGLWDHVPPPRGASAGSRADFWGPGPRIPTIVVSPYARRGEIDSTEYDTTSILKLIAERFDLKPLQSARFGAVRSIAGAFDFSRR